MSEERVTLELLGARVLALTADMRDVRLRLSSLESRFTVMENRMTGLENRMSVLEERISGVLAVVVNIAERLGGPSVDDRIAALEERVHSLEERGKL
jgi:uncharacterized coiled-coil protein SlyX